MLTSGPVHAPAAIPGAISNRASRAGAVVSKPARSFPFTSGQGQPGKITTRVGASCSDVTDHDASARRAAQTASHISSCRINPMSRGLAAPIGCPSSAQAHSPPEEAQRLLAGRPSSSKRTYFSGCRSLRTETDKQPFLTWGRPPSALY